MLLFYLSNINNILNNYIYHYLIILLFFYGDFSSISKVTFFLSPVLFFRDCLSSNNRSLIIFKKKKKLIDVFFFKRFLYIVTLFLLYILFYEYIFTDKGLINSDSVIYFVVFIILILWLNEIVISFNEINRNLKLQKVQFYLLVSLYLLIFLFLLLGINISILIFINILIFFIFFKSFNLQNYLKSKFIFSFKNAIDFNLFSTFSVSIVSLIWRISIFFYLDNDWAGILFVIFAFATFPSTLINNNIGASFEKLYFKNKIVFKYFIFLIFTLCYCAVFPLIYILYISKTGDSELINFYLKTSFFSYFGGILMMFGISKRISNLNKNKIKIFKTDIIYSVLNIVLISILIFISSDVNLFYMLIFFSGLFSLIYFKFEYEKRN